MKPDFGQFSDKLVKLQALLVVLYAVSLPLSLTASWVLLLAGIAVWLCQLSLASSNRKRAEFLRCPPLIVPLALLSLAVFVSGLLAGGATEAFNSFAGLRALIVYPWCYQSFALRRNLVLESVQALLAVGAAAGLFGAVQQIFNFHPFGYRYLQGTGFLGGPMAYAGQMQIFAMLALAFLLAAGYKSFQGPLARKPAYLFVTVANIVGLLFASERSAWLGAVAAVLALGAVLSWRTLVKSLLVLLLVSAVCWLFVPVVHTRISALANWQQDISVRVRLEIWQESLRVWREHPLTGIGIRRFPHFNFPEAIVPGHSKDLVHAHSNYLHILATTGLIGLSAYLYVLFASLSLCLANYRAATGWQSALALGVFAGTVALAVSGFFEYNFGTAQVRLAQWFVLAMLVAGEHKKPASGAALPV